MLANRTFGLLALCLLTLTTTASAIGGVPALPVETPDAATVTGTTAPEVPASVEAEAVVAQAEAALVGADPHLAQAEALVAQAHLKAQIAARQAHAAENARMRFFRLADHAIANGNAEIAATQATPDAAPMRLLAHLAFAADRSALEAERARGEALALAEEARGIVDKRVATLQAFAADPSLAQAKALAIAERLQARADARIQSAQAPEAFAAAKAARAEAAVAMWTDRVEALRAEATADPTVTAFAERKLAEAEARAAVANADAEALAARAEVAGHGALDDPFGAPFRMLDRMRGT